ncbi:hypothetical protein RYX36_002383, partial [Vicia faba]
MYMRNILAFEECHVPNGYISQYLSILDFLVNTEKDVSILVDKRIIVNWMGDANAVAAMVNNLCKNVSMPTLNSKYKSICDRLNGFYENPRNKYKAIFIHEYFSTPWKIASTVICISNIFANCNVWVIFVIVSCTGELKTILIMGLDPLLLLVFSNYLFHKF